MSDLDPNHNSRGEGDEVVRNMDYRLPSTEENSRVAELEIENSRLHRLVAELLIKNQQLRKAD